VDFSDKDFSLAKRWFGFFLEIGMIRKSEEFILSSSHTNYIFASWLNDSQLLGSTENSE
jgi:hypothetical protein